MNFAICRFNEMYPDVLKDIRASTDRALRAALPDEVRTPAAAAAPGRPGRLRCVGSVWIHGVCHSGN